MRRDCILILTICLLLLIPYAVAQGSTVTFTLKECMQYAVENSTKMQTSAADRDDEQVARRDAILRVFTPTISAGSYGFYSFGRSVDPETNTYKSTTSFNNGYSIDAGITLFDGFEAVNNIKISKTTQKMGVSREQQIVDELCLATMQAYYNVVYFTQLSEILQKEVDNAKNSLRLAQRQEELGQKGHADVIQIESTLAEKEYKLIEVQNKLADALLTLKDVMFFPVEENLQIDYSMTADNMDATAVFNQAPLLADTEQIIDMALSTNPAIAIAKGELNNAKLELNTAKWQLMPTLTFNAGWSTSYYTFPGDKSYQPASFANQFKNNSGEYLQLSLSIPIYDRLSRHSNISRKKNAYRRAEVQLQEKTREVESEVKRAIQDRDGAALAFVQAQKRAQVEEEAYRLNNKKFEQGLISSIEFQTASTNYLNAKAERLNSLLQYYIKQSVVSYYSGIPYIEQY